MEYQWLCPKCGGHNLSVMAVLSVKLIQEADGNFQTDADNSDHEWDGCSNMTCDDCRHCDASSAFEV